LSEGEISLSDEVFQYRFPYRTASDCLALFYRSSFTSQPIHYSCSHHRRHRHHDTRTAHTTPTPHQTTNPPNTAAPTAPKTLHTTPFPTATASPLSAFPPPSALKHIGSTTVFSTILALTPSRSPFAQIHSLLGAKASIINCVRVAISLYGVVFVLGTGEERSLQNTSLEWRVPLLPGTWKLPVVTFWRPVGSIRDDD
jgi:hypothetical protein